MTLVEKSIAQQRTKETEFLKKLVLYGVAGSAFFHAGVVGVGVSGWLDGETKAIADEPIEIVVLHEEIEPIEEEIEAIEPETPETISEPIPDPIETTETIAFEPIPETTVLEPVSEPVEWSSDPAISLPDTPFDGKAGGAPAEVLTGDGEGVVDKGVPGGNNKGDGTGNGTGDGNGTPGPIRPGDSNGNGNQMAGDFLDAGDDGGNGSIPAQEDSGGGLTANFGGLTGGSPPPRPEDGDGLSACVSGCEGGYEYEGESTVTGDALIQATRNDSGEWDFEVVQSSGSEAADIAALETARESDYSVSDDSFMIRANIAEDEREAEEHRRRIQEQQEAYHEQEEAAWEEPVTAEEYYPPAPTNSPAFPVEPEPVYEEPVYEEPVYEEPIYEEPAYYDKPGLRRSRLL